MKHDKEELEKMEMNRIIETTDPDAIDANNAKLTKDKLDKKTALQEISDIYDELNTADELHPSKKQIMMEISKHEVLKRRCKQSLGLGPVVSNVQFVNAFMLQPAEISGKVSAKEFLSFATAVVNVGHNYLRAKQKTEEEKEKKKKKLEAKLATKAEMKDLRKQQQRRRSELAIEREEKGE